ncbi:DUF3558 family protein [Corynebacterium sp. A21]|uniref:DUF3558 family protein n=1 Tax=Corynebacterium sp. A21 TaxID=3457318 RepID=UPI003FCF8166
MHLADLNGIRQSYSSTFISHTLVVLLAALACVSCSYSAASSDQPGAGEEERQEETAAEQATTPLIELGEFDGESEDFELFDPCTEIPWEVYQAVGFVEESVDRFYDPGRSATCYFQSTAELGRPAMVGVTGDKVPYERIVEQGLLLNVHAPSRLPGVYHHWLASSLGTNCTAVVHTSRGRLAINYHDAELTGQPELLCVKANEYLENIYEQTGGV